MLHICLLILKIIGIILAVLFGVILLALLLLLYVPVRYQGTLRRYGAWEIDAKFSWLLHSLTAPIVYQKGALSIKIKLFGITIKDFNRDEEEPAGEMDEFLWDTEEEEEPLEGKEELAEEDFEGAHREPVREEASHETIPKPEGSEPEVTEEGTKIRSFFLKIFGIWKKIKNLKYTFRRICDKIRKAIGKYQDIKKFLLDERTKNAVRQCWEQLKYLLGKLLPRKIRGELHFGTEDPALTGEILGGISIFYPIFMDNVKVYPDFEQSILEGELFVKGRLRLMTLVLILWRLWRDKNVRYAWEKLTSGRRA